MEREGREEEKVEEEGEIGEEEVVEEGIEEVEEGVDKGEEEGIEEVAEGVDKGGEEERVEEGVEGRAVVVAGQVVEFSWEEGKSKN